MNQQDNHEDLLSPSPPLNKEAAAAAAAPHSPPAAGLKADKCLSVGVSVSAVVDIIVDLRKSRDGLVETPNQLKFILDVLSSDSELCLANSKCHYDL
jgi:hypothetical protein